MEEEVRDCMIDWWGKILRNGTCIVDIQAAEEGCRTYKLYGKRNR